MTNPTVSSLAKDVKAVEDKLATLEYNLAESREVMVSTDKNIRLLIEQNQASTDAKFQTLMDSFQNLVAKVESTLPTTSSQPPRQTSFVNLTSPPPPPQNGVSSTTTEPKQPAFSHEVSQQDPINQYRMPTTTFEDHQLPHKTAEHRQLRDTQIQPRVTRFQPREVHFRTDYDHPPDYDDRDYYEEPIEDPRTRDDLDGRLYQRQDDGRYDGCRHQQRQPRARLKPVYEHAPP